MRHLLIVNVHAEAKGFIAVTPRPPWIRFYPSAMPQEKTASADGYMGAYPPSIGVVYRIGLCHILHVRNLAVGVRCTKV